MKVQRIEVPGLAHYSYVLSSQGEAVVIDPRRDFDVYTDYCAANDLRLAHILETHIHADFASGAREMAQATGAPLTVSAYDQGEDFTVTFPHHDMKDGESLTVGDMKIMAMHTPGHTPEHFSYLVHELSRGGRPMALFSGDFVFVGSLGRPDLLGEAAKERLAHALYRSTFEKIKDLPDYVEIDPAHGAGSMCGAGMSERPQSTLGYERLCNTYFGDRDEKKFVEHILATVPEFPEYYKRMKRINSAGPAILGALPGGRELSVAEFKSAALAPDAVLIDLRRPEAFGGGYIPGSFNIGGDQNLSMWAAWVAPYDRPIYLVGDDAANYEFARRSLIRVGLDNVVGHLKGGIRSWIVAGLPLDHVPQITVNELAARMNGHKPFVLDVRSPGEWAGGHIEGATHIPGGSLAARVKEVADKQPVHIICGSGYRSSIATSVLRRAGVHEVINILGGMTAWRQAGLPTVGS